MSETRTHKDLDVWRAAMDLVKRIYALTAHFPKAEMYGLVSQMRRCAVSIPSNIAEGAGRNSTKEFVQFLYIGLGSLAELETQTILAEELGFMEPDALEDRIENIRRMFLGLIKHLKGRNT